MFIEEQMMPKTQSLVKLRIILPKFINYIAYEDRNMTLADVHMYLEKFSMLCIFTNYTLSYKGVLWGKQLLRELLGISEKQITTQQFVIDAALIPFTYYSAKLHMQSVSELLGDDDLFYYKCKWHEAHDDFIRAGGIKEEERDEHGKLACKVIQNFELKKATLDAALSESWVNDYFTSLRPKHVEFVQFIEYSGFNPPPEQESFAGDLFYIHLRTLQNQDYHITASSMGFYINQSKISHFSSAIHPNKQIFVNLIDLISSVSELYVQAYVQHIEKRPNTEFWLEKYNICHQTSFKSRDRFEWLKDCKYEHNWNQRKVETEDRQTSMLSNVGDWNESFLNTEELLSKNDKENQEKYELAEKNLFKTYHDVAVQGAKLIVEGKLAPLNPMDQKKTQIFIYKRIFYSLIHEPVYNRAQDRSEQLIPTSGSINTDLIISKILHYARIPKLHLVHNVVITYRGYRYIGQCIIPGLLSSEVHQYTHYGSIDDGKNIQTDPQFHKLMIQVCKQLHIDDDVEVIDGKGEVKVIAGNPDVKGIIGSNQLKYIADLYKLLPRDLNYLGLQNQTCVLRTQLIQEYLNVKGPKALDLKLNTNIETQIKYVQNEKTKKQRQLLQELANFLKEHAVPQLINLLKEKGQQFLTDSKGISNAFHQKGVNLRYLGFVAKHEHLKNSKEIRACLNRVILVKSLKHLFKKAMRESNVLYLNVIIVHLLNCIFGKRAHLVLLNQGNFEEVEDKGDNKEVKKKKKKKNKEAETLIVNKNLGEIENQIKIAPPPYLSMKPDELWEEINKISKARYDFQFQKSILEFHETGLFKLTYQKLATLRDLCITIGLVLERKNYSIIQGKQSETKDVLPFNTKNIAELIPVSKTNKANNNKLISLIEMADRSVQDSNLNLALIQYIRINQEFQNQNSGQTYGYTNYRSGKICYLLGQYSHATEYQNLSLRYYQSAFRNDSVEIIQSFSRLGLYYMMINQKEHAIYYLCRSIYLMLISFGEGYPDILINFANLARVYQQHKQTTNAANCYLKVIEIISSINGNKLHINNSFCYSSLASLHYEIGDIRKSIEYQTQSVAILLKLLADNDSRLQDAKKILKVYREILQNSRNSNSGLPPKISYDSKENDKKKK